MGLTILTVFLPFWDKICTESFLSVHFLKTKEVSSETTGIQRNLPENCKWQCYCYFCHMCVLFFKCLLHAECSMDSPWAVRLRGPQLVKLNHVKTPTRSKRGQAVLFFAPCPSFPLQPLDAVLKRPKSYSAGIIVFIWVFPKKTMFWRSFVNSQMQSGRSRENSVHGTRMSSACSVPSVGRVTTVNCSIPLITCFIV